MSSPTRDPAKQGKLVQINVDSAQENPVGTLVRLVQRERGESWDQQAIMALGEQSSRQRIVAQATSAKHAGRPRGNRGNSHYSMIAGVLWLARRASEDFGDYT